MTNDVEFEKAIAAMSEYLATSAGKQRFRALFDDDYRYWKREFGSRFDEFEDRKELHEACKENAQANAFWDIGRELGYGSIVTERIEITLSLDGRRFLTPTDSKKIEAYLLESF